ncbi:excalibur calcium-binding domain-containing protein, partial [Rhodococcus aetherivorans]
PAPAPAPSVGYKNCTEAWNAGVAPLYRDEPGYAPKLDRDDDGIACEVDPR